MTTSEVDFLRASTPQGQSGVLTRVARAYEFRYEPGAAPATQIALTMPGRLEAYRSEALFPIFDMNLPEGYVLAELQRRFAKSGRMDPMLLLALTGQKAAIGRVALAAPGLDSVTDGGVSLHTILAWKGTEDLFQALSERYLTRTGVSGVQPKLLVPESPEDTVHTKGAMVTAELIVKSAGQQFPGLAINEFVCMSIAREAGIPVPEFYLSDNRQLFVMRRFDRLGDGSALGFEDMTVLMGRSADEKYRGSYASIAKAITTFVAPGQVAASLAQLFDQVMLSCMVGNGDAHLKNFGLLYSDPTAGDARLSPAYDIVNTTHYIPNDELALSLNGSRNLFTARLEIAAFAERCEINNPADRIVALVAASETVLAEHHELLDAEPGLEAAIRAGVLRFKEHVRHLPTLRATR